MRKVFWNMMKYAFYVTTPKIGGKVKGNTQKNVGKDIQKNIYSTNSKT